MSKYKKGTAEAVPNGYLRLHFCQSEAINPKVNTKATTRTISVPVYRPQISIARLSHIIRLRAETQAKRSDEYGRVSLWNTPSWKLAHLWRTDLQQAIICKCPELDVWALNISSKFADEFLPGGRIVFMRDNGCVTCSYSYQFAELWENCPGMGNNPGHLNGFHVKLMLTDALGIMPCWILTVRCFCAFFRISWGFVDYVAEIWTLHDAKKMLY